MKRFVQFVCILIIMAMILAIPAMAAEQASQFFISHSCYLWEISDNEFKVCFDVTAVDAMDILGVSEIKVQRSTDKSNWETVQTYAGIYGYGVSYKSGNVTYSSATSDYYYRAKVVFYAENDSGIGKYTSYTSYI